jgi:hypothetical protein
VAAKKAAAAFLKYQKNESSGGVCGLPVSNVP